MTTMYRTPSSRRLMIETADSLAMSLARQPNAGVGAPDRQREEEVEERDGHDRGAHGAADRDAHARRAALGRVAEVAVRQDDDDREHQHLEEGPDHVPRRQEEMEVVRVGAGGLV